MYKRYSNLPWVDISCNYFPGICRHVILQSNCQPLLIDYSKYPPFFDKPKSELFLGRPMLNSFQDKLLQPSRFSKFLHKRFDLIQQIIKQGRRREGTRKHTRRPSVSVSCHSAKSRVSFSRAGKPRAFLPQGQKSSFSLKRVVDQSRHIWSRFGALRAPLTPNAV